MKVGGTGNSLRRSGTGVLRVRLTDMVEERRGGVQRCMRDCTPSESKRSSI